MIQPGIESFSTRILKLMEKGVTALQNIRLLKWCVEFGLRPAWNVIYGFPGEPPEEYDRMAEVMKGLTHLSPPQKLGLLYLERFSPYYQRPREYGLKISGPMSSYGLTYPVDLATLSDLAYNFEFSYDDGRNPKTYIAAISESIENWSRDYADGSTLSYRRGPGFLVINDRRPGLGGYDYSLEETEAKIYLSCDSGVTAKAAWKALQAEGAKEIELEDIEDFLGELTEMRLMYEEDGLYLSLAVPEDSPAG